MDVDLKEFEKVWFNYMDILPIMPYEFYIYLQIVDKIRGDDFNFSEGDKKMFF